MQIHRLLNRIWPGQWMILVVLMMTPSILLAQEPDEEVSKHVPPVMSLHMAALQGNLEVVRQHIRAGTDLNRRDAYGSIPLLVAVTFDHPDVAIELIRAGADMEIRDNYGSTALQLAALFGQPGVVKALLNHGANRHIRNNTGATAYDLAAVPFEVDRPLFDALLPSLGPLGFRPDYERIRKVRPAIAEMLRVRPENLQEVAYAPSHPAGWKVATPESRDLDPMLVAELFYDARAMENLYGLLILKDGYLVAEQYYNKGAIDRKSLVQSVSKSYVSALVGIALDRGCLSGVDQKMLDFFPAFAGQIKDSRKKEITIRHLLQMRSGYPWEELDTVIWKRFVAGDQLPLLRDIALVNDPGEGYHYSNLSSFLLGVIVSRACETDLKAFAQQHLLAPIGSDVGDWYQDTRGNYYSFFGFTMRDMARLGQLYLDEGRFGGQQVIPAHYVEESLRSYSEDTWVSEDRQNYMGRYFRDLGYGYQWWSADIAGHRVDYAAGHGGQLIILLEDDNMVIVTSADPLYKQHDDAAWRLEQGVYNLVGKYLQKLVGE